MINGFQIGAQFACAAKRTFSGVCAARRIECGFLAAIQT